MADIKFTSKLDGSGFKRGMAGIASTAQSGAQRAGREFTKSFNQQINRYLGVGFAIATVGRLTAVLKEAQQIRLDSIMQGLSPQRLQAMAILAEKLKSAFTDLDLEARIALADRAIESNEFFINTTDRINEMATASSGLEKVLNEVKSVAFDIADAFKSIIFNRANNTYITSLLSLYKNLSGVISGVFSSSPKPQEGVTPSTFLETVAAELAEGKPGAPPKPKASALRTPTTISPIARQSDSLQRIGLFVGGAGNPVIAIQREQIQVLQALLKSSVRLERQIDKKL